MEFFQQSLLHKNMHAGLWTYFCSWLNSLRCNICNLLKSILARRKSVSFRDSSFSYTEMKCRFPTLNMVWCNGCFRARRACSEDLAIDLRKLVVKIRAFSRISSPCTRRCAASYKLTMPLTSLLIVSANLPLLLVNFLNTSKFNTYVLVENHSSQKL